VNVISYLSAQHVNVNFQPCPQNITSKQFLIKYVDAVSTLFGEWGLVRKVKRGSTK